MMRGAWPSISARSMPIISLDSGTRTTSPSTVRASIVSELMTPSLLTEKAYCDIGAKGHHSSSPTSVPSATVATTATVTEQPPREARRRRDCGPAPPSCPPWCHAGDRLDRMDMASRGERGLLIFDGDCGFCTTSARFATRWVDRRHRYDLEPWQQVDLARLGLTEAGLHRGGPVRPARRLRRLRPPRHRRGAAARRAACGGRSATCSSLPGISWLAARATPGSPTTATRCRAAPRPARPR